ncbi:MFS general substrate transporter [Mycena venus]|uniref:MFS general substrate transporter n=1 Tax=Mycena venus TaxID=2733690 RepID=A0A8H6YLZ5_9AGAR|nr:MFS general substrate transporter [Mycena venus]
MASEPELNESQPLLSDSNARLEDQTPPRVKATPLPKAQFAALCIARLSDPIGFTQIFPYINEFLSFLHVSDDPAKIGFYSGIVESMPSVAILTILWWTKLSDIVGRRPVILGCALGLASISVLFGLSRSFIQIVVLRTLIGLFAGNTAVYQTILAEITDSTNQAIAYPIYGGIYPLGATLGPLIGGFFSNLATKYPKYFGYSFLEEHPYFPPGFICACLALTGFTLTYFFLEETNPAKRGNPSQNVPGNAAANPNALGVLDLLSIPTIRIISLSSMALAFLDVGFTVTFILFCYTPVEIGGLGFSALEIGYAMATSSGIFAFYQLILMPIFLHRFDIARMYTVCMGLWTPTYLLLPFLNIIARMGLKNANPEVVNWNVLLWAGIVVNLIFWRTSCLAYPTNAILVRDNAPGAASLSSSIGLNQFSMGVARCMSPFFSSMIFALSMDHRLLDGYFWVVVMSTFAVAGFYVSGRIHNNS